MKRDIRLFIEDILECIAALDEYSKDKTEESLKEDRKTRSAIVRELEIIGEAVKNIPFSLREKYPDVEWKKIVGLRDIIIHGSFRIDLKITLQIIHNDLPILKLQMQRIKNDMGEK